MLFTPLTYNNLPVLLTQGLAIKTLKNTLPFNLCMNIAIVHSK